VSFQDETAVAATLEPIAEPVYCYRLASDAEGGAMQSTFKAPFNAFDFFGYLVAGFVVLIAMGYGWPGLPQPWELAVKDATNTATRITLFLIAAYIVGHVMAFVSNMVLYEGLMRLTHDRDSEKVCNRLPPSAKVRLQAEGKKGLPARESPTPANLFNMAEAMVRRDKDAAKMLERFGSLYSFCRNTSIAFLVAALIVIIKWPVVSQQLAKLNLAEVGLAIVLLAVSAVLAQRFVRFYRVYESFAFLACALSLAAADDDAAGEDDKPLTVEIRPLEVSLGFARRV
jgi:hypothetical protein